MKSFHIIVNLSHIAALAKMLSFWYGTTLIIKSVLLCSLRKTYGRVLSLKIGSYKLVMASSPEAVKEMLIQKSGDPR